MKIKFRYFWANFNPTNNIFQQILNSELIDEFHSAKFIIEIHSVFVRPRRIYFWYLPVQIYIRKILRHIFRRKIIYIWYTGELIAPPKGYDLTLSYAPTNKNNIYWPLWATYVDYAASGSKFDRGHASTMQELSSGRSRSALDSRQRKACAFISNPVDKRLRIARLLEVHGLLDIYGKAVEKPVFSKSEIARLYAFQFCFENTIESGYVTEKPVEAWLDGTIPIYCGGNDNRYLNAAALIDCTGISEPDLIDFIRQNMQDTPQNEKRSNEPILSKAYDYSAFTNALMKIIDLRKY